MKCVHFLGIGGSGTSAAAAIAKAQGFRVSGCDKDPYSEFTEKFHFELQTGHSKSHLEGIDILAITPAILSLDPNNEEITAAQETGIEVITWQEFVGKYLVKEKFVIAVCGTHGKSTTTAMIAKILEDANLDPTVILGAIVPSWGTNHRIGTSKYFVIEADEFNNNFLSIIADIAVVTNIEMDHPEFFKDFDTYKQSFRKFLSQTKLEIIANMSDPGVKETFISGERAKSFKFPPIIDFSQTLAVDLNLKVNGEYNRLNALAAFQVGLALNIEVSVISRSLASYSGIGRRSEYLGKVKGADIYSDFAHHPTEIKVTIETVREKFPDRRIWVIFQPHMFSRTRALFSDFVKVFQELPVDQISIIDIYPSREIDRGEVNSKQLVEAIDRRNVSYLTPKNKVGEFVKLATREGDIIYFIGAGDIDELARELAGV